MARLTRPKFFLPICFALGLLFDLLFWDKRWGISFFLYIAIVMVVGLWLGKQLKLRPARRSWWLGGAALALAAVSAIYTEEYTLLFTRGFSLLLLALFAVDFLAGDWLNHRFSDFVGKLVAFIPLGWMAGAEFKPVRARGKQAKSAWGAVRGLVLALPVVLVLASLLASADKAYSDFLEQIVTLLRLEDLPEYVFRLILASVLAVLIFGAFVYAFVRSRAGAAKAAVVKPFLGFTEASIILGSVTVLLSSFVFLQLQYFFGGTANIFGPDASATFAEYARRGFAELCVVSALVLALFVLLSSVTKRSAKQQKYFSGLGIALLALLAVVLVSAFKRLLLYEEAYGYTSMRLLPHIFMVWLGLLLLAIVVLEFSGRQRHFAAAVLLAAVGFVATLPIINLDAFTVRANIAHGLQPSPYPERRETVDRMHLANLSPDAVPALVSGYLEQRAAGNEELAEQLGIAIACNAKKHNDYAQQGTEWTLSRVLAANALQQAREHGELPQVHEMGYTYQEMIIDGRVYQDYVTIDGTDYGCYYPEQ
ncbi:MAG TPA: DUF4173 domain-containing protein [Anaerolineales bacterium]|nr:DUF4173 domain-containing protein [Anaerolineales bacterium]HRQ91715.1 DUF4173 domain-containing protein [Anaerolineales bacterium]